MKSFLSCRRRLWSTHVLPSSAKFMGGPWPWENNNGSLLSSVVLKQKHKAEFNSSIHDRVEQKELHHRLLPKIVTTANTYSLMSIYMPSSSCLRFYSSTPSGNQKDDIFCKIACGDLPCDSIYQDEHCLAFHDLHPVAPVHILVIPKKHIENVGAMEKEDEWLVGHLLFVAKQIMQGLKDGKYKGITSIGDSSYRLVMNNGRGAGQSVDHLHIHILGGRRLKWPPG